MITVMTMSLKLHEAAIKIYMSNLRYLTELNEIITDMHSRTEDILASCAIIVSFFQSMVIQHPSCIKSSCSNGKTVLVKATSSKFGELSKKHSRSQTTQNMASSSVTK